jgi:PKD repeat protein
MISCSEDDPFPVPIVDFAPDPEIVEVGIEVMLDNLTTNADNYEWDFGDGQISTEISPTVTFLSPGNVTVTLRAFTVDNQVDSLSKTFRVYERVLTGYILNVFPSFNESEAWDPDEAGDEQWPDLAVIFTPTDANQSNPENGFIDGQFVNVPSSVRPIFRAAEDVTPFANPITLTDENWTFLLLDVDEDGQQLMAGAEFNPVLHSTQKNPDGMGGEIQVVSQDGTLDADIFFELQ